MFNIRKSLIATLVVIVLAGGCSQDILDVNPTVVKSFSGVVVQTRSTGIPVANALVECMGRVALTDTAGRFTFPNLPMDARRTIVRVYSSMRLQATHAFVPTDSLASNYIIVLPSLNTVRASKGIDAYVFSHLSQTISLPLDAFVTRQGAPYTDAVTAVVSRYDMGLPSAPMRLGDNAALFADGTKGVLERTTVAQYAFLGADKDTVFVRPNTICTLEHYVSVAPEFESTMAIFTFDHTSAYWKVSGQATLDSNEYRGTFVWGNDVTMNFLRATRRPAKIRVVGPDKQPIRWCVVSLSGKTSHTDSLGYCSMLLSRGNGTLVEVRDATNTEVLATYSLDQAPEADPGEHTIVIPQMPAMLTGSYSFCESAGAGAAYIVLHLGKNDVYFVVRSSPFSIPIPRNPQFDVFAHNNASLKSGIVRVTPASVVNGVVNVGNLLMCASNVEDQSLLPLPAGSTVVSAANQRTTGGVFVITTNKLLTYNSKRELVASMPLSTTIGLQDTAIWSAYVSSNDQYIYVTNARNNVYAIEAATGRILHHHAFQVIGVQVIGVDVESAQLVYAYRGSQSRGSQSLHYRTYNALNGNLLVQDSLPLKDIGRPIGVEGVSLYKGRSILLKLQHLEWISAVHIRLEPKRDVTVWGWGYYSGLSKGGSLVSVINDGNETMYNAATDRYVPFPAGITTSSFFTSTNDHYIASRSSGRITVAEVATGRQTVSKQILPPRMGLSHVDLSDNGKQLCVIVGLRTAATVLAMPLD